jgi:hypothetical protein
MQLLHVHWISSSNCVDGQDSSDVSVAPQVLLWPTEILAKTYLIPKYFPALSPNGQLGGCSCACRPRPVQLESLCELSF